MPEDLTPDGPWPLPTGRDELLQRVVTAGRRRLLLLRLLVVAAIAALAGTLAAGAVILRDPGSTDDAAPAVPISTTRPAGDEAPTSTSGTAGSTSAPSPSPTTSTTAPPPSTSAPPGSPGDPTPSPTTVPPTPDRPPDQAGPEPNTPTVPTPPPPTTRPGPSTTPPPSVTAGPVRAEPEAIVERGTGPIDCPGRRTSMISATVGAATSASLTWQVGGASGQMRMVIHAGTASAVLGPFDEGLVSPEASPSSVTVTVTANGPGGTAHGKVTLALIDCPRR